MGDKVVTQHLLPNVTPPQTTTGGSASALPPVARPCPVRPRPTALAPAKQPIIVRVRPDPKPNQPGGDFHR